MAINEFKAFATGENANVIDQNEYEELEALTEGFQSGIARSEQLNKVWRQATTGVAALAQFISDTTNTDVYDNGEPAEFLANFIHSLEIKSLSRKNPFSDIMADGEAAINQAVTNLRLGAGAPAIGIPFFWPSSTMPNTVMDEWADMVFLKLNGSTFSATVYPKLSLVIPTLKLPDARGEFPRIWDDGRGIDNGRGILTTQSDASQKIYAKFYLRTSSNNNSVSAWGGDGFTAENITDVGTNPFEAISISQPSKTRVTLDTSMIVRTANETRPRNIAFNFLVRAK
ncbi:phage tail protein [Enterobacteriaceae bacterium 4M9]|nr:phage tail protein [Enterobacteriaceae bacterium 4M9]